MNKPAQYNTTLVRGDTFQFTFVYKDAAGAVDLTGATAEMAIRWKEAPKGVGYFPAGVVSLTGTVEGSTGTVGFTMPAADTLALPDIGAAEYQIRIDYSDGVSVTPLVGTIIVYPNRFEVIT